MISGIIKIKKKITFYLTFFVSVINDV